MDDQRTDRTGGGVKATPMRYRWFRPTIPLMLLGALLGWFPDINGNSETEAMEAFAGAAAGLVIGLMIDLLIHQRGK